VNEEKKGRLLRRHNKSRRLAQKRKMDYNYYEKGELKQLTKRHTDKFTDGNFP
jgi:hypothetical protein